MLFKNIKKVIKYASDWPKIFVKQIYEKGAVCKNNMKTP